MVAGSMRKPLGLGVSSTKVPMPWRVSTRPAACKRDNASRTTVRLTPCSSMIADSVGNLSPRLITPSRIRWDSSVTNSWARLRCFLRTRGGLF
ncbi:hypothetical protein D3C71_1782120 [compost metagenome]